MQKRKRREKFDPNKSIAWFNKGVELGKLGQHQQALECYDQAIKLNPEDADAWSNKGLALGELGQHQQALECFDQAIKLNPEYADAWFSKGAVLGELDQHKQALECFDQAIKLNPEDADAWSNKGLALGKLGQHQQALEHFDQAIKLDPGNAPAWCNKGMVLGKLGQHQQALGCYDQAIKLEPEDADAWFNNGVELGKLGQYEQALERYDQAIKLDPGNAPAWCNKGMVLGKLGEHQQALERFDQAIKLDPENSTAWFNKGLALGKLGQYQQALECFDQAIKLNPEYATAWYSKGAVLRKLSEHKQALKCYNQAIKLNPEYADAWFNKGLALGKLGQHKQALECFDQAIKLDPKDASAWFNKGVELGKLGQHKQALECYDQAIKLEPEDAFVWSNKGVELGKLGQYQQALECFDQAIKLDPEYVTALSNKSAALGELGQHELALIQLEQALEIDKNEPMVLANRGLIYLNLRKYEEAQADFNRAIYLFDKKGDIENRRRSSSHKTLARNAKILMSELDDIDEKLIICQNSSNLSELQERSLEISEDMKAIIRKFDRRKLPEDTRELLHAKATSFDTLLRAARLEKVDLENLRVAKDVFQKWGLDQLIYAANCIDTFARMMDMYDKIEDIPDEKEPLALRVLKSTSLINGDLTEEIIGKIRGKPYSDESIGRREKHEPRIIFKSILAKGKSDSSNDGWVRFGLVQLDYSVEPLPQTKEFGYTLCNKDDIKKKVFGALDVAVVNSVDVICFPELSFAEEWVSEIESKYTRIIIICGSYYKEGYNVCPIIVDGTRITPPYKKIKPSPYETPEVTGRGMKSGNIIYIIQTRCGRFSVLTCIDYAEQSHAVVRHEEAGSIGVDFIINPCYDPNVLRSQFRCNADCEDVGIDVIQINKAPSDGKFGETCIIGKENEILLERLKEDGFKPIDYIKYKLFRAEDEMMVIADIRVGYAPPVSVPLNYKGRIRVSREKCFIYGDSGWIPLSHS